MRSLGEVEIKVDTKKATAAIAELNEKAEAVMAKLEELSAACSRFASAMSAMADEPELLPFAEGDAPSRDEAEAFLSLRGWLRGDADSWVKDGEPGTWSWDAAFWRERGGRE